MPYIHTLESLINEVGRTIDHVQRGTYPIAISIEPRPYKMKPRHWVEQITEELSPNERLAAIEDQLRAKTLNHDIHAPETMLGDRDILTISAQIRELRLQQKRFAEDQKRTAFEQKKSVGSDVTMSEEEFREHNHKLVDLAAQASSNNPAEIQAYMTTVSRQDREDTQDYIRHLRDGDEMSHIDIKIEELQDAIDSTTRGALLNERRTLKRKLAGKPPIQPSIVKALRMHEAEIARKYAEE